MAASPRPPSWAFGRTALSSGVLGETALPWFWVVGGGRVGKRGAASWLEPLRLGLNLTLVTLTLADEPALAGIPADELRMDLACGMYREGKITAVTAAHLAGVGIVRFQEELRDRSIPRAYDTGDLESDLAFLRSPLAA